jgi:hypothetical protein
VRDARHHTGIRILRDVHEPASRLWISRQKLVNATQNARHQGFCAAEPHVQRGYWEKPHFSPKRRAGMVPKQLTSPRGSLSFAVCT